MGIAIDILVVLFLLWSLIRGWRVGFQLGGGVDIYLSRHVSIGGKLLYRGAHLDNAEDAWPGFPTESAWLNALTYGGDLKFHF